MKLFVLFIFTFSISQSWLMPFAKAERVADVTNIHVQNQILNSTLYSFKFFEEALNLGFKSPIRTNSFFGITDKTTQLFFT